MREVWELIDILGDEADARTDGRMAGQTDWTEV